MSDKIERTDLERLDDLVHEVKRARSIVVECTEAVGELKEWGTRLSGRWAATNWSTEGLDTAIAGLVDEADRLQIPEGFLERLTAILDAADEARVVGEAAASIGATGNLSRFTSEESAGGRLLASEREGTVASISDVQARIRQAYIDLAREPGQGWISLVSLRAHLGDVPRAELDAALRELSHEAGVHIQAEANQQTLTAADREAAVEFGGSSRHALKVEISPREAARIVRSRAQAASAGEDPVPTPVVPDRPVEVTGEPSSRPPARNGWGADPGARICFHDEGPFGRAIAAMGPDARMDVDGEPLADVLGVLATEVVGGRRTAQEALDGVERLRDRIPAATTARTVLDRLIAAESAPDGPVPAVPDGTPAYLARLVADLYAVPMVRRDPDRELEPLLTLLDQLAVGQLIEGRRFQAELEQLGNRRHESLGDVGKFEIDRAVQAATQALRDQIAARSAQQS